MSACALSLLHYRWQVHVSLCLYSPRYCLCHLQVSLLHVQLQRSSYPCSQAPPSLPPRNMFLWPYTRPERPSTPIIPCAFRLRLGHGRWTKIHLRIYYFARQLSIVLELKAASHHCAVILQSQISVHNPLCQRYPLVSKNQSNTADILTKPLAKVLQQCWCKLLRLDHGQGGVLEDDPNKILGDGGMIEPP